MARVPKSSPAQSGSLSSDFSLALKPAELDALLERLCSCSTLRVNSSLRARYGQRCPHGVRTQWCRLGERGVGGERAETRFG
jgi:hypothetical protein